MAGKLSIKTPRDEKLAAIIDDTAKEFAEAVDMRSYNGVPSPTRLFYMLLFAFRADKERAKALFGELEKLGGPGLEAHYLEINRQRSPSVWKNRKKS